MIRLPAETRVLRAAIAVALFALTLLLFARALGNDFVNYDDPEYVTANAHVKAGLTPAGIAWALRSGAASNWHPLTWVSHMMDVSVFGMNPRGHHATSVLLHALNAALAFLVVRRLTGALWTSALFAALFAWHPLRVESVAWVAERKDVLSGLCWLLTLWCYAIYVDRRQRPLRANEWPAYHFYALALIVFALGLMAKPMLVTLPCVLLLLDVWPLRRMAAGASGGGLVRMWSARVVEKIPFFVLSILSSIVTFRVQKSGGAVSGVLGIEARLENAVVAVVSYIGKFLWPSDLAVLYPHPGRWAGSAVTASLAVVIVVTTVAWWQRHRRPWIGVGWLWFLGTLVPVIGLVQVGQQSMADRYTYIPIMGVMLMVLWTAREAIHTWPRAGRAVGIAAVMLLLGSSLLTWKQIGVWKNSFTLFDHAIAVTERNYVAHDNRGLFQAEAGRIEEAMADYRRSIAIHPSYLNPRNNLGLALSKLGRPAEAVAEFRVALQTNPNQVEVRNNLANALSDLGQLAEAMEHYDFILARQPDHVNALNGSAVVLAMQNRLPEARARLERSLKLDPNNASAHGNLGNVCSMLGLRDDAVAHYRRSAELNPKDAHAHFLIGMLRSQQDKFAEAAASFERALQLRPNHPEAHAQLGFARARLGQRDAAIKSLTIALQQQPDYPAAKAWLEAVQALPAGK